MTPDKLDFFKKGEKKVYINSEELISKLLDAGYSAGYLRAFVEQAEAGSLSPALAKRLAEADETMLGDLQTAYPDKFEKVA